MAAKISEIFTEYEEANKDLEPTTSKFDTEQEIPVEKYCCITGEAVKSSFCRYPDEKEDTMMVMSKEQMLLHSRNGGNISEIFKQVLALRRKREQ
ncbi:MAG: hypothetical protein OXI94_18585 [Gemmatimonadota bacterium]|nr:hypothetical protein [Gemmatimonadota bacterium]